MRRKSIIGLCISFAFLGIIVLSIVYCFLNNNDIKTEYLRASYAIDVNDMDEMAGFSDYVFVGYVSSQARTEYLSIPYTVYNIKILDNLKGTLSTDNEIEIFKSGGISEDGKSVIIYENDIMPEVGKMYVFFACGQPDGSLLISGENSNLYIDYSGDTINISDVYNTEIYRKAQDSVEKQKEYDRERFKSLYEKND